MSVSLPHLKTMSPNPHLVTKIVLNRSIGAFSLSEIATNELLARKGNTADLRIVQMTSTPIYCRRRRPLVISDGLIIDRTDPDLISIVEELGRLADGSGAELAIVTIPANLDWAIGDVCGIEFISAGERVWPLKESDN